MASQLQRHRLVGGFHVQRAVVVLGEDSDGVQPHLGCRPRDADGDFATVGDQDALETHTHSPGSQPFEAAHCPVMLDSPITPEQNK